MSKKLIICEKPSLAMNVVKAIGKMSKNDGYYENDDYIVTFAFGHLLSLYDVDDYLHRDKTSWKIEDLPFYPDTFKFKLKSDAGVKKQFNVIEKLILSKDVDEIINCGDADREGEVIINNIINEVLPSGSTKKITRLWLPEQTEDTIRLALKNCHPIEETKNLMNEGLARTYVDWLYGINLTRYVTIKSGELFPVGRVLVPIVKYVYDRDVAIKNFVPKDYYEIGVSIFVEETKVDLNFKNLKFEDTSDQSKKDAEDLVKRLSEDKILCKSIVKEERTLKRPKLFSLDTLQNFMFKKHKFPIAKTLKCVQELYEKGYTSYPRTNTEYLAENEKDKVKGIISALGDNNLELRDTKSIFDNSKIESHSAITITSKIPSETFSDKDVDLVYNVLKNRFKAVFCKNEAIIVETKATFVFNSNEDVGEATLIGNQIKELGYLQYEPKDEKDLPNIEEGNLFSPALELKTKSTVPPAKINESSLNTFLKSPLKMQGDENFDENAKSSNDEDLYKDVLAGLEIGTVATRAGIIENTIKYKYIEKTKNNLSITNKGINLIEYLDKLNIDMGVNKTIEVQKELKDIYKNELTIDDIIKNVETQITQYIDKDAKIEAYDKSSDQEVIGVCPKCGKNVLENSKSFYCEDYKNCNFSVWKSNKYFDVIGLKKFTKSNMKSCLNTGSFKATGLKSKTGKEYDATLVMDITDKYVNWKMEFK